MHFLEQTYTCYILAEIISDYTYITPVPSLVRNHNYYLIKGVCLEETLLLEPYKFVYDTLQFNTSSGLALYLPQAQWKHLQKAQSLFCVGHSGCTCKTSADNYAIPPSYISWDSSGWQQGIRALHQAEAILAQSNTNMAIQFQ